ncbi:methionine gamma-lyase [Metabacillus herbersteinensis]|uniref:L-methionine gamma-lyase n=1 Tax=Metabacillus herbersteinensis TaxID=283816 RepID=A0ABV6G9G0_9BACI
MFMKKQDFRTKVIHGEATHYKDPYNSLVPPIYQTATFTFDTAEQVERRFAGDEEGPIYSRLGNPTVQMLEQKMAVLEEGEAALAFGSGMGAVSAVVLSLVNAGDHILCSKGVYGCTFGFLNMLHEKFNVSHTFSNLTNELEIESQLSNYTTCIYIETPINPTMQLIDLALVVKVAKKHKIKVVVDNTFSSPYLQQPLLFGCDIVLHSATKYLCGHGDVIGGIVVSDESYIEELSKTVRKDIGAIMSPFDAWLLLRGLKTLAVRMDRHCENAEEIVNKLSEHPKIESIVYPFSSSDQQLAKKQMKQGGGLITFSLKNGSKKTAQKLMNELNLIKIAVSLGDAETLIQHPATMTHAVVGEEERERMGITENMIRLSIGLEAWEDIWNDLEHALQKV